MTALELLVLALVTYRLTRLVVRDTITAPIRERWLEPALDVPGLRGRVAYGLLCPWCLSVHVAALTYVAARCWPTVVTPVLHVLAVAAVAGLLLDRDR